MSVSPPNDAPSASGPVPSFVAIGLENPKTPDNVGSVLRAVGCFNAQAVYYTGQRYDIAAKHHTDTKNVQSRVPLERTYSWAELKAQLPEGTKMVCVELALGATSLPEFEHPERALYVFGPEDGSLAKAAVSAADAVVYIPTIGCLNLAATVNVLLYDRLLKRGATLDKTGDELILASRDNRNRLKV
ncbi:tRNA(Leu) C34 or U34 (ribose-2'-O)-methylase TrmL [Paraperlucidibaca baekdonensis]|uniref:tRNA(Leu) C34 or U34 (Ribose-2'-O)-methylase TrmL n=1 Tax=Paraperlucidibaca baekdonensis TaxID=748120 RepID=A0A3E0H5W6_9GAMM|nr:RNA methyltransferase [Paraperlucidibaca baekdonensis]REH38879.1 tRNA(Leu) C34 or U34 (ribose-2'-O)-methylase TrmL [Paraperlucidibaca baekdonensis]